VCLLQTDVLNSIDFIVGIFVDDGIMCVSNEHELDVVVHQLANMFKVNHGCTEYYIKFQVHHEPQTHIVLINQPHYVSGIIKRL
jgi:uncharacterized CHY-type Zn-finger protein